MPDGLEQLLSLARQVWRRRWLCLAVAWPLAILGCAIAALLPSSYESSAQIFADTQNLLIPLLKDMTVEPEVSEQLEVMQRTLLSRQNLAKVIEQTPLARRASGPAAAEALTSALARDIRVTSQGRNLFAVAYRDHDPETAAAVVRSLLDIFIAGNLGASRKEMDSARRFIDEQIGVQERALEAAERRLADFQKANVDFLPGEKGYFGRLQQARAEAVAARTDLAAAVARRDELRRQLVTVPSAVPATALPNIGNLGPVAPDSPTARLAALERRLAELRNRYTERHPDVQAAEREIAALRAQTSGAQGGGAESGTVPNPVHDQIRLQLVQLEGEIASFQDRQARAERLVQELSGLARVMPEADAEYKRLTRDYEVIKKNYEELVAKRESVRIADDMASQADRGAFRIIDPPKAALLPVSPPRLLLLAGALVGSLGTGVGIALAQALLVRPFDTLHDLQRAYSLPVIASVTEVLTSAACRRRAGERARFAVVAAAFALLFASVAAAEHLGWFGPVRDAHHLRPADAGAA